MFDPDFYPLALEIANGFGFTVVFVLLVTMIILFVLRLKNYPWDGWVMPLMIGMITLKVGLSTNLAYRWAIARCHNLKPDCSDLEDDFWLLFFSILLVACGAAQILRILSLKRTWIWGTASVVALAIPITYYGLPYLLGF